MSASAPAADDVCLAPILCLLDVLKGVEDPRSHSGRRHSLSALLGLLVLSFCAGEQTVKDAVLFGRNRRWLRKELGFTHPICPSQSTYTRLFKSLKVEVLREALSAWLLQLVQLWAERRRSGVCATVDGKTMRGSGVHVLNVFVQGFWVLLDQYVVASKENEMSGFRARLDAFCERYPFLTLLTFDAIFCEQQTMRALTENNRMGIFQVKDNQPEGLQRLERWFAAVPKASPSYSAGPEKKWGLHRDARGVRGDAPR